jgi:hypothetical protein
VKIKLLRTILLNRPGERLPAGTVIDTSQPGCIVSLLEAQKWELAGYAVREQPSKIVGER